MKKHIIILLLILFVNLSFAANVTWTNTMGNNDWNTAMNWSTGAVPGASDVAIFDGTSNANATLSAASTIGGITMNGYTGIININGQTFQITSGNCDFTTGTINGGTLTINTTGNVTFAGTTFGAIVNSQSARLYLNGSTFNAVTTLEKNGAGNDNSNGGNTFAANTTITNSSSGNMQLERTNSDNFSANLNVINSGTAYTIFSTNAAGTTVGGDLVITNSGSNNSYIHVSYNAAATLDINGNVTVNNTGTGTQTRNHFGVRGTITIGGDLTVNNNAAATTSRIYLAFYDDSQISITGNTTVSNNGSTTNANIHLGYYGDITFNGTLDITNNSSATNSRVYLNTYATSVNAYNENITVESTHADCNGISFGEYNGSGTLAASKTITVGAGGFIAGVLEFRNFTQTGNTAHALTLTGTGYFYNYDSDWGGNVNFIAPRMITRGTKYNGTAYLEKNGAINDGSAGGNIFVGNTELKNSGSGYFMMGNGNSDDFQANLIINNTGTNSIYIAYNSAGNTIGGNFTVTNTSSGVSGNIYISTYAVSTLVITGTTTINNNSTATTGNLEFGSNGTTTCNGNVTVTNNGAQTTKRIYIGNNGDITFNGTLDITNNSSATNSEIFLNHTVNSSNTYKENITVESTHADCDGIRFGQNNGTGTLAANKTITVGGSGYIAGVLEFRNFTQTGNTAQALTLTGTGYFYSYDSDWGGNVNFIAPRMITRGTTYNGTTYLEKTGAENDNSIGGNVFNLDVELKNSGSGDFLMGIGVGDTCKINLLMNNAGTDDMYFAYRSSNNYIGGNLTVNNVGSGTHNYIHINDGTDSTTTIQGNVILNNNSSATSSDIYIAQRGDVTINGNTTVSNNGNTTTNRVFLANYGSITFNGTLDITNNSPVSNSQIYCNYSSGSVNMYNENITVESTVADCDGVLFGNNNGSGILAATKTITIGAGGFVSGDLQFRNFTQTGNTAHSLTLTGTARIYNYDSNWGGDVTFIAPRMITRGTKYDRTAYLEKTGAEHDDSAGGNVFKDDVELKNSGSGRFLMSRGLTDTCMTNLIMNNTGTHYMYFAHRSSDNYIGGDLTINNTGSGATNYIYFNDAVDSTTTIQGNVTINNNSTATTSNVYFATNGSVTINGNTAVSNNGNTTTNTIFLGDYGDITFNGTLDISNNSSATASSIFCNYRTGSINSYNENITVESTVADCDGVLFGQNNGSGTLAATKTITISAGGFVSGNLTFRNFTQVGATNHNLTCTGTATITNYDSNWGGNVVFIAPRHFTRGTTYNGTAYLEKTGANSDASAGGNTFKANTELRNSGSGYFLMGNGNADIFQANLEMNNTGTNNMYLAHNSAGNTIAGNLTVNNTGSGSTANMYFCAYAVSTIDITGTTTLINNTTSTNSNCYFANAGNITCNGDVSISNISSGTNSHIYFGDRGDVTCNSDISVLNNCSGTNANVYIGNHGDVDVSGNLSLNNSVTGTNGHVYVGYYDDSQINITGNTTVSNSEAGTTKRIYLGYNGDITFDGTLKIENSSSAANSQIYLNSGVNSHNDYNENITVECTHADCDGIIFGSGNGSGTLAATKTITISAGGFIAGQLYFRNFTQVGPTDHNLTCTGTATLYNYDSNWGGNVNFVAPRHYTRGTTYNGTAYLEKTGAGHDASAGGNTIVGNTTLTNSGSGYFLMGNGSPDDFQANLEMNNTGTYYMYLAHNSAGNHIGGNLTVNNLASGTTTDIRFLDYAVSTLTIDGTTTLTNNTTSNTGRIYFGNRGDITCNNNVSASNISSSTSSQIMIGDRSDIDINGNLTLDNSPTGTTGNIYVANNADSEIEISGNTSVTNDGAGITTSRVYLGSQGDITFNGTLDIVNSSSATNSQVYLNYGANSHNDYNENITVQSTHADCDGILFGNGNGSGTLAATKTISIPGGAPNYIAGYLYFRNFTQVGPTNHTLNCLSTGTATFYNYDSNWGGNVNFIAPRHYTRGTTYNGTAYLEKTGAGHDASVGGNTIIGNANLTNSGSGYFLMGNGNPDDFQANLEMNNTGTYYMYLAYNSAGNNVGGNLTVNNLASGVTTDIIILQYDVSTLTIGGTTNLNNNTTSTNGRIYFGNRGTMTCNNDVTASNIGGGTTTQIMIGDRCDININGNLTLDNSPTSTNGYISVANNTDSQVQISGNTSVTNTGGNIYRRIYLGSQGDITFNGTLDIVNSSSATNSQIYLNHNVNSHNDYNENITVQSTNASSDGIIFGEANGSGTLAATKTITISGGAPNYIAGYLSFRNFTQVGATAQTLNCLTTGTAYINNYDSDWGGNVNFIAPQMATRGTVYNGTSYLEKTNAGHNSSAGGNTFKLNSTLKNSGSGYFLMGNGAPDDFQANLEMYNTGTYYMYLAHNSTGNKIAGTLNVSNTGTGAGTTDIVFCAYAVSTLDITGATTLSNNPTSHQGRIYFAQNGTTNCANITATNNATNDISEIHIGESGDINITGDLSITNTSTNDNHQVMVANNTASQVHIIGNTTVDNSGAGSYRRVFLANQGDIIFDGTLDIVNSSSATYSEIFCNYNANSINEYNDNITVQSTNASSDGVRFGQANGSATLANGKTITISGGGANYIAGDLRFRNFTQAGGTAQLLHPTGTSIIYNIDSEWNGNVDFISPRHYSWGTTYNGTAYLEKIGAGNDNSTGGNTFNGVTTIKNSGTNYLMFANGTPNDFNANVTYIKSNTGILYPTYNCASTYAGDINIDFNAQVYFGAAGNGRVVMDGTAAQSINDLGASTLPLFRDFQTNNPNSEITLNTPIEVTAELDLDAGNIITTSTNLLTMRDNSTVSSVSDDAYVRGPIEKIGNDAFEFPVGDSDMYRPISMSAPSSGGARFRGEFLYENPWNHWSGGSGTRDATIDHISSKEYWYLNRIATTNSVNVTLSWRNPESGGVGNLSELLVARWNGSMWKDHGNGGTTGNTTAGTVITSAAVTSFSPFTLASTTSNNPLPIEMLSFTGEQKESSVELIWQTSNEINNDYYIVERSYNGVNYKAIGSIEGKGTYNGNSDYNFIDNEPLFGISYYRLKQIDLDGKYSYYGPVDVNFSHRFKDLGIKLYPNPVTDEGNLTIEANYINTAQKVQVVDIKGSIINIDYSITENKIIIKTLNIDKGIYTVVFNADDKLYRELFIVK